jgi:hypothetical protein
MKNIKFVSIFVLLSIFSSIQAKTLFKCVVSSTLGTAPVIDELSFTFDRSDKNIIFNDGMVDIYWGDGTSERIQDDGLFMYSFKQGFIGMNYEGVINSTIILNDKYSSEYWHRGNILIRREHYYLIKCVDYSTL